MMLLIDRTTLTNYRYEILLGGILVLSAFFNIWNIWNQGISNTYYAAAVKTMLVNPAAGFFTSLDPAGFITVDKPPVGLWVQAAFAAVLGFSGWVLVLPQALAGIASVALIYCIISRPFGKPAGLIAALALAVTPIFVAVSRNGTMDTQMIFVILLTVWAALRAARTGSLPWFLAAVALIGVGFNIKMIQAFIVIPAVFAVCLLGTTGISRKKKILHTGIAIAVLLIVSLSWVVVVDSFPAKDRPYIGGSGDNTVLGLIIDYNGLHRLGIGDTGGGFGARSSGSSAGGLPDQLRNESGVTATGSGISFPGPDSGPGISGSTAGAPMSGASSVVENGDQAPYGMQAPGSSALTGGSPPGGSTGGGGMNSGGTPGVFRLFREGLAGDIAWLLMFALIGVLSWVRRPKALSYGGFGEAGYLSEKGLTITAMLLWLVPGLLYFSFTTGFWHDYYIATIAPPLAGLVGIGAIGMHRAYISGSRAGWLLVIAVLVTGLIQTLFLSYNTEFAGPLLPVVLIGTLACTGLLALTKVRRTGILWNHRRHIIAVGIAILFIAPLAWSCTPILTGNGGTIPTAGPPNPRSGMPGIPSPAGAGNAGFPQDMTGREGWDGAGNRTEHTAANGDFAGRSAFAPSGTDGTAGSFDNRTMNKGPQGMSGGGFPTGTLAEYLLSHTGNETWILAVPSAQAGSDLIITTGRPVMCLGGFSGSDQVLDLSTLQEYVREGRVRYFLADGAGGGGGGMVGGNTAIFSWVTASCTAVNLTGVSGSERASLYDCRGAAGTA